MMRSFVAAVFLFGITNISCIETHQPQVAGVSRNTDDRNARIVAMENDVLLLINEYRKTKKLPALIMNDVVSEVARTHSANMASRKVAFGHGGFDARYKTIITRVPGTRGVAENVAYGQLSAKEVVEDWIKSEGHRHNIEANYKQTGIGIVADRSGVLYYTQMFTK